MENFEKFLEERNNTIYNAAYEFCKVMLQESNENPEIFSYDTEDMEAIVNMVERYFIEEIGLEVCNPHYAGEDEIPCYMAEWRCENCKK